MCRLRKTATMLALAAAALTAAAMADEPALQPHKPANQLTPNVGDAVFPLPDLMVPDLRATAKLSYSAGYFSLPVRFTVANRGERPAAAFKLALHASATGTPSKLVKFTNAAPGQKPGWYAWSPPLDPRDYQTFVGRVSLPKSLAGKTVRIQVHADSTAGEEFSKKYGRVAETSEKNNWSKPIGVRLPLVQGTGGVVAR